MAALVIAYLPVWQAGFIWDDDAHVTNNPCVVGPLGLKAIWTSTAARICPLTLSSFWLQYAIWGSQPLPYHLVTLLMHAGAAIVLWRVLVALEVPGAWLGAALWALHPMQVESAAWITELKNTQSALFYMLTGLFFVKGLQAEQQRDTAGARRSDGLAWLFAAMAMASKSSTVILPLVLGLCGWWLERSWRWRSFLRLAPYFLLSALSSALALWTQGLDCAGGAEWVRSWPERFVVAGKVFWFYLGKLFWPDPLMFVYPKWHIDASQWAAYVPTGSVLIVLAIFWRGRKGWGRGIFMAIAYYLAALLPVLGLFNHYFLRYSFVGDHFQYLAAVGPLALGGAGLWRFLARCVPGNTVFRQACCGLLLGCLAIVTFNRAGVFHDNGTLWQDTLNKNPGCWLARCNYGVTLAEQGRLAEAIQQYELALQIEPNAAEVHHNLANELAATERRGEAILHYERALQIQANYPEAHNNLGVQLAKEGKPLEAMAHWERAVQLQPAYTEAEFNLGRALVRRGEIERGVLHFRHALASATSQTNPALLNDLHAQLEQLRFSPENRP